MSFWRLASGFVLALALFLGRSARAQPSVEIRGDATCPSTDMVRAALHGIGLDAAWLPETVVVDVSPERLSLALGDQSTRREIPATADCLARAEAIALVIRAWSGDLPSHPTSAPVLTVARPAPAPAPARASNHAIELDAAVLYSPLWGHAPGIWLAMGRTPRLGGLGFRVFGAFQSAQDVALAGGNNSLRRVFAGAAPTFQIQQERFFSSVDLGLLVTMTRAQGEGYPITESARTWNLGAAGDIRAGVQLSRFRCWLNTRLLRLFHQETITIASSSPERGDTSRLNPWDVQIGIGMGARF